MSRVVAGVIGALCVALACAGPPPGELAPCPPAPEAALVDSLGATVRVDAGDPERGEAVFGRLCARCHASEAAARESRLFRSYPRLDCASYVSQTSPGYLYTAIAEGGAAIGKRDLMKPFAAELTDGEIVDLVEYIQRGGGR